MECHPVFVLFISHILLDSGFGLPLMFSYASVSDIPETTRFRRSSLQPVCAPKRHLTEPQGIITSPRYTKLQEDGVSCSWKIHVPRGQRVRLDFRRFDVEDECPGYCSCNYVAIKEPKIKAKAFSQKYCNEEKPPRVLVSTGRRLKIHLRLRTGSRFQKNRFTVSYTAVPGIGTASIVSSGKVAKNNSDEVTLQHDSEKGVTTPVGEKAAFYSEAHSNSGYADGRRVRKVLPTTDDVTTRARNTGTTAAPTEVDDEEPWPSKLTVLLAIAIPVVLIFVIVVLVIAYSNHKAEQREAKAREDCTNNGTTISDLLLNTSFTLTPMFNLKKAKRESSHRREKANQLYDDMLQNWRLTNANQKERMKAKQESVNVWESYQASRKQRLRSTRESESDDNKAFAVLVSNAINVATSPTAAEIKEPDEEEKEVEKKSRPSSILLNRHFPDEVLNKRGSKVLSWSNLSKKSNEEKVEVKRTKSETELKVRGSDHIPAIVVSQPSFEAEDDDTEATDTDRLIKDQKDGAGDKKTTESATSQPSSSNKPTYSCSEHVKDILRESYGDELEEWWQKPKKSESQGSLKHSPQSEVKYKPMKTMGDAADDID